MKANEAAPAEWHNRLTRNPAAPAESPFLLAKPVLQLGKNCWRWLHLLSLDAPLVGVLWQLLFARALRVHLPPVVTLVMALVIWLIYVADRILDSYRTEQGAPQAARHRFYRAHRLAFLPAFLTVLLGTAWMSYADLGFKLWRDGLLLAAVVGGYFALVHLLGTRAQKWFPKEIAVATLFGIGTFLPVGVNIQRLHARFLLPFLLFLLVLWMNTLLIEYSEWVTLRGRDAERPHESTVLLGRHLAAFGFAVGALALCATAGGWFPLTRPILLAEGLSALALGVLGWQWRRISSYAVRVAADVVLLTPLLLLLKR
ncbi:MAG TPA: hypothetical protein VMD78_09135 [Candidatus Baltobacteraceae bacterium]|nr:hypothetical protein [Candidatus Baltobacteraceae bacterium]